MEHRFSQARCNYVSAIYHARVFLLHLILAQASKLSFSPSAIYLSDALEQALGLLAANSRDQPLGM